MVSINLIYIPWFSNELVSFILEDLLYLPSTDLLSVLLSLPLQHTAYIYQLYIENIKNHSDKPSSPQ